MVADIFEGRPGARERRCLIVLPTYNERANIEWVTRAVLRASAPADVLVVDDSSPDGTADLVRAIGAQEPRVALHQRRAKLGLGSAYLVGFRRALEMGYDAVCTMDSDRSHDPAHLPAMLALLDEADLIIGSRYCAGAKVEDFTVVRRVNSAVANGLAGLVLGVGIRDHTSGYRVYATSLLRRMDLESLRASGYSLLVELLHEARRCGARIVESPIQFKRRHAGSSKINLGEVAGSLVTLFQLRRGSRTRAKIGRSSNTPAAP